VPDHLRCDPGLATTGGRTSKWRRLKSYEKFAKIIDRDWDSVAAYCKPENKVRLGYVEGLNTNIRAGDRSDPCLLRDITVGGPPRWPTQRLDEAEFSRRYSADAPFGESDEKGELRSAKNNAGQITSLTARGTVSAPNMNRAKCSSRSKPAPRRVRRGGMYPGATNPARMRLVGDLRP
jgi:hypothetical protein